MTGKRIALLLPSLRGGGAERVALTLAEGLLALGDSVDLVLGQAHGELLGDVPAQARVVDLDAARLRGTVRPLARYLRAERPAAVQASMWPLTCWAVLARRLAGSDARLMLTDHVNLSAMHADHGRLHDVAMRASMAATYPAADVVTAVSRGAAADVERLANLRAGTVQAIPNPIPPPRSCRDVAAWPADGARILSVGTLKPQKNHALLLDAFARVAARRPARLAIVGEGALRPMLEAQARTLGIAERVAMPGFAANPACWYAAADLLVLSSDYEGFANVLVEALAHGVPVVSTDCPDGPSEVLDGGRFGRLVPPGDAGALAAAILASLDARHDHAALKARARDFAPAAIVARYRALLLGTP